MTCHLISKPLQLVNFEYMLDKLTAPSSQSHDEDICNVVAEEQGKNHTVGGVMKVWVLRLSG